MQVLLVGRRHIPHPPPDILLRRPHPPPLRRAAPPRRLPRLGGGGLVGVLVVRLRVAGARLVVGLGAGALRRRGGMEDDGGLDVPQQLHARLRRRTRAYNAYRRSYSMPPSSFTQDCKFRRACLRARACAGVCMRAHVCV
jgi:hypothetical protein